MFSSTGNTKKMTSFEFSLMFILTPLVVSYENADYVSFSVCWMSKDDVLERQNASIWLNEVALTAIGKVGKVKSLTVSPGVENTLTLHYGGSVQTWTLTITPGTTLTKVRGQQKPQQQPLSDAEGFQDFVSTTEVFACENSTLFFHQDEKFFLAFGYTEHLPIELQFSSPSMLVVSWVENDSASSSSTTALYHTHLDSYRILSMDTTTSKYYSFTALDSCSPYVVCVEIASTRSFTCLSTITDPEIPRDLKVTSWNSSSISLAWAPPENHRYSLFLLTAFYLNGTDHVTDEVPLWHMEDNLVFILSGLQPCSRVRFGLQTICEAGMEIRHSEMVLNDGNSLHSRVEALCQTSYGPNNYTLSWEVRNTSLVSMFRVYHEGALQGNTSFTEYTVGGLLPCQQYEARVEALCGDGVVMNVQTVTAHTGLRGVSDLRYRSNDSTALWSSSLKDHTAIAFLYELSLLNGTTLLSSRVSDTELHLPGLEDSKSYILDVWEQCGGQWESEHSRLCVEGTNSSLAMFMRAAGPVLDEELDLDISSSSLTMLLPWSLPEELQNEASEPRATMKEIITEKLQSLLEDFDHPIHVELVSVEPVGNKTETVFVSFDASQNKSVPLPFDKQWDYFRTLNASDITVADWVIYWDGPDLCASSQHTLCPQNSLCINTLGSYICVCKHGYYDVSAFITPHVASHPVCNEKGLFSQCLHDVITGAIAKPYLTSHMGGKVDMKLNNGRCAVREKGMFYYFQTSQKASACGTKRQVNGTHIEFQNTLHVSLSKEQIISRRDLKIIWKCVYPRQYTRNAAVTVGMEWLSSLSLVEFSSSLQLGLGMTLFTDESYSQSYKSAVQLESEDTLFFEVALHTNNTFATDVLLQVDSCWATESIDPDDSIQGLLLLEGCPVDETFYWLSINGVSQKSRFSVQMFTMPQELPLYIHCLANICGPEEDCVKNCSSQRRTKRSVLLKEKGKRAVVVSAGPVLVNMKDYPVSYWAEHMTMIFTVAGFIGFLMLTVLSLSASKAIMAYYERLRLKVFYQ